MKQDLSIQNQIAIRQRLKKRRHLVVIASLGFCLLFCFILSLVYAKTYVSPFNVMQIILGNHNQNATFTVLTIRLPRALVAILSGFSFGLAGAAFQTILRNPLASPDIIGISSGASAAAVFSIVVLSLDGFAVCLFAIMCGLLVALTIYGLAFKNGLSEIRLILIGIAVSAMLQSFIAAVLLTAPAWSLQEAMRWLTGSLNGATLQQATSLLVAVSGFTIVILRNGPALNIFQFGNDKALSLGVEIHKTRLVVILAAVTLMAFATAISGPIAFVAFLSGPIATHLTKHAGSTLLPAALVGALLVLGCDYCGQYLLPMRYPVGVITGLLGASYLICLIVKTSQNGTKP